MTAWDDIQAKLTQHEQRYGHPPRTFLVSLDQYEAALNELNKGFDTRQPGEPALGIRWRGCTILPDV